MVYESSYESGRKPFQPDASRGHWAKPSDFTFLCLGLAFKLDFFLLPMSFFIRMGIFAFIPYLICLALYVVPIMVMHSFMGQFSSSGFISAFRVSPLFKGMGYISLGLNFSILTYYSIFATMPMWLFLNSFRPTLPWSCEAFEAPDMNWNVSDSIKMAICNSSDIDRIRMDSSFKNDTRIIHELPSVLYFQKLFPGDEYDVEKLEIVFAWQLVLCTFILWGIIAFVFFKYFNTPVLGKILRFGIGITLTLLVICIIRFMCLPGAVDSLSYYILPDADDMIKGIGNIFIYTMYAFGPGWGSIISLSSFNKFNTNIMRDSWIICLGQMLIFSAFNFAAMLINWHYSAITSQKEYSYIDNHWNVYVSTGTAIANMKFANLWSLLFYGMLTLAALIVMITQLFTLLISIFDEFENLRQFKSKVTFAVIGMLALLSIYFCTNEGIIFFLVLSIDSLFTQTALNLLLLLVVLWIYGRERFQRDIEFMLGQPFATWKVNMLRFVAPLCLLLILLFALINVIMEHVYISFFINLVAVTFLFLPWFSVPAYGFYITLQTSGPWQSRLKRSCRPTDWYPVEREDRQRYEEAVGNEYITHQLNELSEEVL